MAVEIKVPSVGESITEGTLSRWLKANGAAVRANEPVCELETDKATTEVMAPASGTLAITIPEGQKVTIGAVVGRIEEGVAPSAPPPLRGPLPSAGPTRGSPAAAAPMTNSTAVGEAGSSSVERASPAGGARSSSVERASPADRPVEAPVPSPPGGDGPPEGRGPPGRDRPLSPAARHLAANEGLDPRDVAGTGRGGRVTKEDILTHLQQRQAPSPAPATSSPKTTPLPAPEPSAAPAAKPDSPGARASPPPAESAAPSTKTAPTPQAVQAPAPLPAEARETRQRMSPIRQRIAERLLSAQQTAAILTTFNEADVSGVMALRARFKETFQKKHGVGLGFMSFFVKAVVEALRTFPAVNARIDGSDIVYQHFYDIGVAVSTDKGLMVPVLRDADRLSLAGVEKGIAALAQKARDNKITVADLQGGTFTITNGGIFGSLLSTPILNPPQSAILGMHAIQKRPVAVDDQVVIRPMMYLALSYDHRLIDGREAVSFLVRIKECIESPERLMLEI